MNNQNQTTNKKEDTKMSNVTKQNQNNETNQDQNNQNEIKKENGKMKQFTIKELSDKTNIPQGTIRAWTMKPIPGKVYNSNDVNYQNLQSKLIEYYGDKLKETIGCKAMEVEIVKGQTRATKDWLKIKDLKIGDKIILHNYTLKTPLTLISIQTIKNKAVYIFEGAKGLKAYTDDTFESDNIKIEHAE